MQQIYVDCKAFRRVWKDLSACDAQAEEWWRTDAMGPFFGDGTEPFSWMPIALLQLVRYIHLNPVEAGLVEDPGAYPWSSHRLYRRSKHKRPAWLCSEEIMAHFRHRKALEQFIAEGNDQSLSPQTLQPVFREHGFHSADQNCYSPKP